MHDLHMRQAQPGHMALVMELVTETTTWLAERGIQQWPSPPGPDVHRLFEREIAASNVYLAQLIGSVEAVGLLRFEWHDPYLWPDDPDGGGYVHSLLVRPNYHGQRVGASMLEWAAAHVRAHGRRYLRLDCVVDNWTLRRYYECLGFRFRGVASDDGYIGALFEMDLAPADDSIAAPSASE